MHIRGSGLHKEKEKNYLASRYMLYNGFHIYSVKRYLTPRPNLAPESRIVWALNGSRANTIRSASIRGLLFWNSGFILYFKYSNSQLQVATLTTFQSVFQIREYLRLHLRQRRCICSCNLGIPQPFLECANQTP